MTIVRTFDAAKLKRGPLRQLASVVSFPGLIWQHRYMVHNFFRRDLLTRVNGSFLGVGWILVQPLFLFAVYYFVFGMLFRERNLGLQADAQFAIYLFSGVIIWQSFIEATSASCGVIVDNGNLVKKVAFPSEALFVHIGMVSLITYLVGAIVCVIVGASVGVSAPGPLLAALPLVLVVQFVLQLGLGMILANAYVFVRDTVQLWRLLSMAWMFVTPVFWDNTMLAKLPPALVPWLTDANPMYPLMQAHRLVLGGPPELLGDFWSHLAIAACWATGFFLFGYTMFMGRKHKFADLV